MSDLTRVESRAVGVGGEIVVVGVEWLTPEQLAERAAWYARRDAEQSAYEAKRDAEQRQARDATQARLNAEQGRTRTYAPVYAERERPEPRVSARVLRERREDEECGYHPVYRVGRR